MPKLPWTLPSLVTLIEVFPLEIRLKPTLWIAFRGAQLNLKPAAFPNRYFDRTLVGLTLITAPPRNRAPGSSLEALLTRSLSQALLDTMALTCSTGSPRLSLVYRTEL